MKFSNRFPTSLPVTLITIGFLIISCQSDNKTNDITHALSQKIALNKYATINTPKHWQIIPSTYDTIISNTDTTYNVRAEGVNNCMLFSRTSRQTFTNINRTAASSIVTLDTRTRNTLRLLSITIDTLNNYIAMRCLGSADGSQRLYYIENISFVKNRVATDLTIYSPNTAQYRDTIGSMMATLASNDELVSLHQ
ncbi:hypothetical protein E5K02_21560 [Hymenobacter metallicola]|uniref:Uncharacterized protein n=1 Tax=Hymenobacter metallicola TaxID=2563114 RepID=A0A4Z0Q1A9_9BACT|nr:hypothetical protein E5K02_21560 [Hymenobacter metallicola]